MIGLTLPVLVLIVIFLVFATIEDNFIDYNNSALQDEGFEPNAWILEKGRRFYMKAKYRKSQTEWAEYVDRYITGQCRKSSNLVFMDDREKNVAVRYAWKAVPVSKKMGIVKLHLWTCGENGGWLKLGSSGPAIVQNKTNASRLVAWHTGDGKHILEDIDTGKTHGRATGKHVTSINGEIWFEDVTTSSRPDDDDDKDLRTTPVRQPRDFED